MPDSERAREHHAGSYHEAGRDERAVAQFIETAAHSFGEWGFPRMAARILLTMMSAEEDELTAAELAERLSVSPPAISGAVRYLVQVGLIERRAVPGSRRDRYQVRDDAWYASSSTIGGAYKILADLVDTGVLAVGGPGSGPGARLADMRDFFRFVHTNMADLLERWQRSRQQ